jgi:hypothetical protein
MRFTEISDELRAAILRDADYDSTEYPMDGCLAENEIAAMHKQVSDGLLATNGDDSECVISTRQLAILLAFIADTEKASA